MKKSKIILGVTAILLVLTAALTVWMHPISRMRGSALQKAVCAVQEKTVTLDEIVPFEWDAVYTIAPYTSQKSIRSALGITGGTICETTDEGMQQLIFVKGDRAVACVCGYPQDMGYKIMFEDAVQFGEKTSFEVTHSEGLVILTKAEE